MDIGGAIIGAASSASYQHLFTDNIDIGGVVWAAGVAGVSASVGAAGKLGRWLFRLN